MHESETAWRAVEADKTAFFLDVDGTLLGFRDRPEDVVADADLLALLSALSTAAHGAVALVSGRMIDDLDRIVAPLVLPAGGTHGADLRFADGRRETMRGDALAGIRDAARVFVDDRPGLMLEDKGTTLAIHYRHAAHEAQVIATFLDRTVEGQDLMVQHGKMVAEVKSNGSNKGSAIASFMSSAPFAGRIPLFIGDDLTDEHGFESVNALGGISIKVGPADEKTIARHRLEDTHDVRNFLTGICRLAGCSAV